MGTSIPLSVLDLLSARMKIHPWTERERQWVKEITEASRDLHPEETSAMLAFALLNYNPF